MSAVKVSRTVKYLLLLSLQIIQVMFYSAYLIIIFKLAAECEFIRKASYLPHSHVPDVYAQFSFFRKRNGLESELGFRFYQPMLDKNDIICVLIRYNHSDFHYAQTSHVTSDLLQAEI